MVPFLAFNLLGFGAVSWLGSLSRRRRKILGSIVRWVSVLQTLLFCLSGTYITFNVLDDWFIISFWLE